ncbi:MAG: hypothetical protein ACREHG_08625 [Candidatus Saccharimonadales bacterium]
MVEKGSREVIVGSCFQRSALWRRVKILHLHRNMRLDQDPESEEFAKWLLNVGHGRRLEPDWQVLLPQHMICREPPLNDRNQPVYSRIVPLIQELYPGIDNGPKHDDYFLDRNILSPQNDNVMDIDTEVLQHFPGNKIVCLGTSQISDKDSANGENQLYPVEFLASINDSGLPLTKLELKIGCPLMILRNLDPKCGLCNGTRAILTRKSGRVLEVRILTGPQAGQMAFIPRITLIPSLSEVPFKLRRRQFPVHLAFAMTINKAQGQSVKHIGLDLWSPVFTHGQLYVALSRCTSSRCLKVV